MDSYYTVNLQKQTQQELVFNVTAEGLPLPVITWQLGDDIIEGTASHITQHEVRSIMKYNFTEDDCGKDISYEITGFRKSHAMKNSSPVYFICK